MSNCTGNAVWGLSSTLNLLFATIHCLLQSFFTIHHIGNILNNLKKTSKTGRNVGFKDISATENPIPGNNLKVKFLKSYFPVFSLVLA